MNDLEARNHTLQAENKRLRVEVVSGCGWCWCRYCFWLLAGRLGGGWVSAWRRQPARHGQRLASSRQGGVGCQGEVTFSSQPTTLP